VGIFEGVLRKSSVVFSEDDVKGLPVDTSKCAWCEFGERCRELEGT
jgi:hypothetical protein